MLLVDNQLQTIPENTETHCDWSSNYLTWLLWLPTEWYTARIKSWRDLMLMPNITMNACGNCDGAKLIFKISVNKQKRLLRCNSNLYWKIHGICRISLNIPLKSDRKQPLYQEQQPALQRYNLLSPPCADTFPCNISTKSLGTTLPKMSVWHIS